MLKIDKIDKRKYWIIAFVISSLTVYLFYVFAGMVGGKYIVMRSDYLSSCAGFFKDVARNILSGKGILFSYSIGLGLNNSLSLSTTGFSFFNILYLILYKVDENVVALIIIVLKIGLISASFQIFCRRILKNGEFSSVIISVFYSLCAFSLAYGTIMIMWLDALYLLPLLCIAIIDCIENNKRVWLTVIYAYLFISSFYMGYMVGIFSFLFFVMYLLLIYKYKEEKKGKEILRISANWILCVVIAVMISSIVWAPTLFFIMGNRVPDSSGITDLDATLLQILNSLFWGNGYGIAGFYAYIYCGIPILFLVPLYYLNKKIRTKEKLLVGGLTAFFLLCTICTPLNSLMHAFDQPDSFLFRYSYIISFCLCAAAAREISFLKEISKKSVIIILSSIIAFYLFIQQSISLWGIDAMYSPSQNSNSNFIFNVLFCLGWLGLWYCFVRFGKEQIIAALSVLLIMVEIITGTYKLFPVKVESNMYYAWYDSMENAVREMQDQDGGLYRTIVSNNIVSSNSDNWFGFNGISDFSDQEKYSVRTFLSNLGFATSTRWCDDTGYTPVSEMLLGIKYNIVRKDNSMVDTDTDELVVEIDTDTDYTSTETTLVQNEHALSMGYLVQGETIFFEFPGRNVFENSNELVKTFSGLEEDCFVKIPKEQIVIDAFGIDNYENENGSGTFKRTQSGSGSYYYTVKNNDYDDVYLQVQEEEGSNYGMDYFLIGCQNRGTSEMICAQFSNANKMYYNEKKDKYNIYLFAAEESSPETLDYDAINIYAYDEEAMEKQYNELKKGQLQIDEWSNGHIKGSIDVKGNKRLLFLSIPYDAGWKAKVNGQDTEIVRLIDGAFIGIYLPGEGQYTVEFDYEVPGLRISLYVSLLGFVALLTVAFEKKLKAIGKKKS